MPKIAAHGGPSYAGHADVSSPDTVTPDWVPAAEPETAPEPAPVEPVAGDDQSAVSREAARPSSRKRGQSTSGR